MRQRKPQTKMTNLCTDSEVSDPTHENDRVS